MNEVSKYPAINDSSFENLHFPLYDVNIETWVRVLEATVQKHLLSRIVLSWYVNV